MQTSWRSLGDVMINGEFSSEKETKYLNCGRRRKKKKSRDGGPVHREVRPLLSPRTSILAWSRTGHP
jgi:hypothetical protein